ncbi:MAG: helix-turn-helix domain-containing protein [Campylobacterota bacterium]|nr:helix-turn-helix domain-containing protein [Campylobacterota bacterium]
MTTTTQNEAIEAIKAPIQKEWLSPKEVEAEFGLSKSTTAKWRMSNKHLKFSKVNKYIKYKRSDIIEFLEAHIIETVA